MSRGFWRWFAVVALLTLSTLLFIYGLFFAGAEVRMRIDGAEATGLVEAKEVHLASDGTPVREVTYRFTAANGEEVRATRSTPVGVWNAVAVGQEVSVLYVKSEPSVSRLGLDDETPYVLLLVLGAAVGIGLGIRYAVRP